MFDIGINDGIIISGHTGYKPFLGSIGIKDGRFAYIGEKRIDASEARELRSAANRIIMPGLYNCHCHGDMTMARGMGDNRTLQEQNDAFGSCRWFYDFVSDEDRYLSRQLTYGEALLSGTVFIVENMYWGMGGLSVEAMSSVGIKGALAEDVRKDFAKPEFLHEDSYLIAFAENCRKSDIIPMLGTISEEDFQEDLLLRVKALVDRCEMIETRHLAENDWREELVKKRFGTTPVQLLDDLNCLHDKMIGSHGIYISETEMEAMARNGVKIVNTPLCEMKIGDGIAPIPAFLRHGVNVCLGTDGAMWNNSNDIFREMKGMMLLHSINSGVRSLSEKDVLDMATINGAKSFGLEGQRGTIEEGKWADFITIDTEKPHLSPLRLKHQENIASTVVYAATGADVEDVYVEGKRVVENHKLLTIEIKGLMSKVNDISERIGEKYELSRKID